MPQSTKVWMRCEPAREIGMRLMQLRFLICLALVWLAGPSALAQPVNPDPSRPRTDWGQGFEEDYEKKAWQEIAVQLPLPPKKENLQSFYVSAATEHRFFVDLESISSSSDGVVRYTLVIETSGGAKNISFEGIRCQTREWRQYAFGRSDGSWSKSRKDAWQKLQEEDRNRHRAALFVDYFCPGGVINSQAANIKWALKRGGY